MSMSFGFYRYVIASLSRVSLEVLGDPSRVWPSQITPGRVIFSWDDLLGWFFYPVLSRPPKQMFPLSFLLTRHSFVFYVALRKRREEGTAEENMCGTSMSVQRVTDVHRPALFQECASLILYGSSLAEPFIMSCNLSRRITSPVQVTSNSFPCCQDLYVRRA